MSSGEAVVNGDIPSGNIESPNVPSTLLPSILSGSWTKVGDSNHGETSGDETITTDGPKAGEENKQLEESLETKLRKDVPSSEARPAVATQSNGGLETVGELETSPVKSIKKSNRTSGETNKAVRKLLESRRRSKQKKFNNDTLIKTLQQYYPKRRNLGTIVYNPTTTWETLQYQRLVGLKAEHLAKLHETSQAFVEKVNDPDFDQQVKYISMIPPLPVEYSNSLIEIKIPHRFIKQYFYSKEDYEDIASDSRQLWGGTGGIYLDDSNIVSVLLHSGLFNGTVDLLDWNKKWTSDDVVTPLQYQEGDLDLSVTLLLLPPIESYVGFYANGINSRSWVGHQQHRGLSYVVYNLKWESSGAYLRDKSIYKDALKELAKDEEFLRLENSRRDGWKFDKNLFEELKKKYKEEKLQPLGVNESKDVTA